MAADCNSAEPELNGRGTSHDSVIMSGKKERNSVFVRDHPGEYISKLEDTLAVQKLIVQEQISEIKRLKRHTIKVEKDCNDRVKKVNDIWKYRVCNEGTRSGIMLKRALQNEGSSS